MEGKEKEQKHKHRLKGLFSKEKKIAPSEGDVDDFLRSPSDKLYFEAPTLPATSSRALEDFLHVPSDKLSFATPNTTSTHPPLLTRLDTSSARRWPTAAEIQDSNRTRGRSASPKRGKKGLVVRFTDAQPEVIGEGGDEAELPTIDLRRRAHSHPPSRTRGRDSPPQSGHASFSNIQAPTDGAEDKENFRPGLRRRAPTGFESISDGHSGPPEQPPPLPENGTVSTHAGHLRTDFHDPTSFAARLQAEMRKGEGLALLHSASNPSNTAEKLSLMTESPATDLPGKIEEGETMETHAAVIIPGPSNPITKLELPDYSPIDFHPQSGPILGISATGDRYVPLPTSSKLGSVSSNPSQLSHGVRPSSQGRQEYHLGPANEVSISRSSTLTLNHATVTVGEDAIQEFSARVAYLFNIFLLSAESKAPISNCSLEEFVRAALWWFLKGRLHLESTIRDRPATPEAQQINFLTRQQAYVQLAKSFWILEIIAPQYPETSSQTKDGHLIDILETRKAVIASLKKLAMSMKRNNFLPPEEATLPQGLDTSIWIQDDGNRSLLASQKQVKLPNLNDYLPLGDTNRSFHYGRAFAGASLIEDSDSQSQEYRTPVLISIIRGHSQTALTAVIASQDGMLKVCVQADKSLGPTWDAVSWNSKSNVLNIALPRGFLLRLQCNYQDFRTLRGIYDYQRKTHGGMVRQQDEELVFETFLKSFQYFDEDPASTFPKEALNNCRLRLFEKTIIQKAASGVRSAHRGFRIGLVTGPTAKNLRGINQEMSPTLPIQFDFLRSDEGLPTLLLRLQNGNSRYRVALTFEDANERSQLHARLTGMSFGDREAIVMESEIVKFSMAGLAQSVEKDVLKTLDWQRIRVVGEERGESHASKSVSSTNLRVVTDFNGGVITDRVNVGPGELRIRIDVNSLNELKVLRQSQQDMTISVSESQVSKDLLHELTDLLSTIAQSETIRTYTFPTIQELHTFQAALTGYSILFDGLASSFNISRRRMVVPIYKKWDAAKTRLQVVEREKAFQLIAFFENFSHGECMNFALKSTDVFETSGRHAKQTLRIVDAKFAMPRPREAGNDSSFVCLDVLEYAAEHDDITIVFENEADYELFTRVLPAPVKTASRMPSVRR